MRDLLRTECRLDWFAKLIEYTVLCLSYRTTPTKTSNIRKLKAFFGEKVRIRLAGDL